MLLCAGSPFSLPCRRVLSLGVFATLGVPLALVESLPYMMVGMFSPHDKHGQLLGKLNVWIGEEAFRRCCWYICIMFMLPRNCLVNGYIVYVDTCAYIVLLYS